MSSQQGPKAAPGQHSAHIFLGLILREHQSTSANFLGNVGEGSWSSASLSADVFALGDVPVGEEREAAILHNSNLPVCASKLLDYAHRDFHGVVGDIVSRTVCMH